VLARRELLFAAGPFNNKTLGEDQDTCKKCLRISCYNILIFVLIFFKFKTLGEDHDMWQKCLRLSPLVFVRDPLVYWRVDSPDKLTQSHKQ
jgi:hypothetical protein